MTTHRVWNLVSVLVVAMLIAVGSWEVAKAQEDEANGVGAFMKNDDDKLVPFTCYDIDKGKDLDEEVTLKTQFEKVDVKIKDPRFLCAPTIIKKKDKYDDYAARDDEDDILEGLHLKCFNIKIDNKDKYDHGFHAKVNLVSEVAEGIKDHREKDVRVEKEKLVCLVTKKKDVRYDNK